MNLENKITKLQNICKKQIKGSDGSKAIQILKVRTVKCIILSQKKPVINMTIDYRNLKKQKVKLSSKR